MFLMIWYDMTSCRMELTGSQRCCEANVQCINVLSLSLRFNGHFPGESGWRWWWQLDNWSYKSCKTPFKSSPPRNQHHFFTGRMPFLQPNQQCQSTEGKISHSMDLLTPSSPGVFQLCLWPLIAPGYGCHVSHQPSINGVCTKHHCTSWFWTLD